jgi:hypothetical protein
MFDAVDLFYPLDFSGPLDSDGQLRATAVAYKQAALHQLHLAETGDNVQQRLVAANVHMLCALVTMIEHDVAQTEDLNKSADLPIGPRSHRVPRGSITVQLFHNLNPAATTEGYCPDSDRVVEVYSYHEHDVAGTASDQDIVAGVIEMFGVVHEPARGPRDHRIANYVDRGNRALTIGDVIAIDRRCYALTDTSTAPVAFPLTTVSGRALAAGSIPL